MSTRGLSDELVAGVVDVAIIGAGVVGCALARRLTLEGARVAVIEKALDVLDGASKGNSAILHTGFDAPPGSLEQWCIAEGYRQYMAEHSSLGLPVLKTGALVLAWSDEQLAALTGLIDKAQNNGIQEVQRLDKRAIMDAEPHLGPTLRGGFRVPGEYLIDPWSTAHSYLMQAMSNGATLHRASELLSGQFDGSCWRLSTSGGHLQARHVINAAGLYGDVVQERLLGHRSFTVTPRKGQFLVFEKAASRLANHILLPVPTHISKGVVVCRTVFGNLLVGPTAEDQHSKEDASTEHSVLIALQKKGIELIPALQQFEVTATYAGLRPATEFSDYQIHVEETMQYTCTGGIRSTGLSASLGIAEHVYRKTSHFMNALTPLSRPLVPAADRLSSYHERDWQTPGHGGIVCHCEQVTRREINKVLDGPLPPATLQGLKRRTRVCMGQCQGFHCSAEVAEMSEGRLQIPIAVNPPP